MLALLFSIGKKRKTPTTDHILDLSKKVKCTGPNETTVSVTCGPHAPSEIFGAVAIHQDNAYFAAECGIHVFHVPSRNWTETIHCQRVFFGLATIGSELVAVGGIVRTETASGVSDEISNKITSLSLTASSVQHAWEAKYPAMRTARMWPQVVVTGKYLIVVGGWTELKRTKSTKSVEVLDLELKCWYSSDQLSLPEVFTTAKWQSACICGKHLFIAAQHDDPNFEDSLLDVFKSGDDYEDQFTDVGDLMSDGYTPYRCISMFRCSVETLLQIAQETSDDTSTKLKILWQTLKHPHPALCITESFTYRIYHECTFTLASINSHTLIAVGCDHIESTTAQEMESSLYRAYEHERYQREIRYENRLDDDSEDDYVDSDSIKDGKCHIYVYDMENDSWKHITSTPENGSPNYPPSVAVINGTIVILRNSNIVHICSDI